jgi:hypothetical protein
LNRPGGACAVLQQNETQPLPCCCLFGPSAGPGQIAESGFERRRVAVQRMKCCPRIGSLQKERKENESRFASFCAHCRPHTRTHNQTKMALSTLAPRQASFRPAVCRARTVRVAAVHQPRASAFVASAAAVLLVSLANLRCTTPHAATAEPTPCLPSLSSPTLSAAVQPCGCCPPGPCDA